MARTRQFDEQKALDAAVHAFWEKGYEGTSMQDLEDCMGLTRTSIYNAFGNKREIFKKALLRYRETVLDGLIAALDSAPTIREGILRLLSTALDIHFREDNPGGCLCVLSLLESEQHDAGTMEILEQTMRGLKHALKTRLAQAKKAGELPPSLDPGNTATTITATMAGMMVLGKAGVPRSVLKKTINQITGLLD